MANIDYESSNPSLSQSLADLPESLKIDDELSLKILTNEALEDFFQLITDKDTQKFIPWAKNVVDIDQAAELLASFAQQRINNFSVRYGVYSGDSFCGYFGIFKDKEQACYQTGSALMPMYRGLGIINKTFTVMQEQLVNNLGAKKMATYIDESNDSSKKMIIKRGYAPTDEFNEAGERRYERSYS